MIVGDDVPAATADLARGCREVDVLAIGSTGVVPRAVIDALDALDAAC